MATILACTYSFRCPDRSAGFLGSLPQQAPRDGAGRLHTVSLEMAREKAEECRRLVAGVH
jgi:hypothetical protein